MNKNVNDEKYKEYQKKKISKYVYIILALLVIVLEGLAVFNVISMVWGMVIFVSAFFVKKNIIK